jgi:DDE family transposase
MRDPRQLQLAEGCAIGRVLVRDPLSRSHALPLQQLAHQLTRGLRVAFGLEEHIQDLAFRVHSPPETHLFSTHTTLSRRAGTLEVPRTGPRSDGQPVHLLVDSTGLKLFGPGEWLLEKHGSRTRRSWKKLHLGLDADTGQIVASVLTGREADDGAQVGPLLDRVRALWSR